MEINVGDDVTINGVVINTSEELDCVEIRLKSGQVVILNSKSDINTHRPKVIVSGIDHRKGN